VRWSRKATFHYKGKLQEVFRAGLNESKYDYVDSNSIFIYSIMWQQQTWKHFAKSKRHFKQWRTPSFPRLGANLVRRSHPARSWQHKIKETLLFDALLAII